MADIDGLIKKIPHNWLYAISYRTGDEKFFFARINYGNMLRGYLIESLLKDSSMVINYEDHLDRLYITGKDVKGYRIANNEEKAITKEALLKQIEPTVIRSTGTILRYNMNAKSYIEALPIELPPIL